MKNGRLKSWVREARERRMLSVKHKEQNGPLRNPTEIAGEYNKRFLHKYSVQKSDKFKCQKVIKKITQNFTQQWEGKIALGSTFRRQLGLGDIHKKGFLRN